MDVQRARLHHPHLNCSANYLLQQKSLEELKETFLLTMELEDTRARAQDQIKHRDAQIVQLKEMLRLAIKERNQAQDSYHKLMLLLHYQTPNSAVSTADEDDPLAGNFSSSDADESIVSSPPPPPPPQHTHDFPMPITKPLPEKGKLLEAVVKAGPLLQNLLLAGPLPQWRHPPPPIDCFQIPPVVIPPVSGNTGDIRLNGLKRVVPDEGGLDCSGAAELKYQRVGVALLE